MNDKFINISVKFYAKTHIYQKKMMRGTKLKSSKLRLWVYHLTYIYCKLHELKWCKLSTPIFSSTFFCKIVKTTKTSDAINVKKHIASKISHQNARIVKKRHLQVLTRQIEIRKFFEHCRLLWPNKIILRHF